MWTKLSEYGKLANIPDILIKYRRHEHQTTNTRSFEQKEISKEINELGYTNWLGLGWLRAVARGYNYSSIKIEWWSNFQRNLKSWGIKLGWGLDGGARRHKVTITVPIALNCDVNLTNK